MSNLQHIVNNKIDYYLDDEGFPQGVCILYCGTGQIEVMRTYRDGKKHGECIEYSGTGKVIAHRIFVDDELVVGNAVGITEEEKFHYSLKYGITEWLS